MSFYRRWIIACAAGELVGIGVATGAALAINALIGEPQSLGSRFLTLATFAAVGAVEGTALAGFQWRVLRTRLPRLRAAEWVAATVAIAVTGWIVGMTPSLFINHDLTAPEEPRLSLVLVVAAMAGAGAGLCFGCAQWFILRRHAEHAGRWIWIHVPAWALAMSAIFLGASMPSLDSSRAFIALTGTMGGVLGGLVLGAVTGLVARELQPWVDERRWSLKGRVCAVTGGNSGIGQEVSLGLARLGGSVVLLCRRTVEGERVRRFILAKQPGADVSVVTCDVGDFASIRLAARAILTGWPRLDVLVHNAGATFPQRTLTVDGIEATLAVDVVGPFLLTTLLRDRLDAARARVVTLTGIYQRKGQIAMDDLSFAHRPYDWLAANNQAQRGRWLFMSELARRAPHLTTAAVHPGAVLTGAQARLPRMVRAFIHTLARPGFVRPEVGAIPVLRLAADPDLPDVSGRFFDRCRRAPDVADPALAQAFWAACEQMIGERWSSEMPQRSNRDASWSRGRGPTVFQQREDGMSIEAFINRHPVLAYYALTFAISWGGFVLVVGPGGFASTSWQTEGLFLPAIMAMLAGPSIAGVLLTGIVSGRAGLREVLSRLLLWRVAARWYAMALLPAPLLAAAVLFALSLTSPIFTTDDKAAVLLAAIAAGFTTVFEEIGWTGFAVPRLRLRHGVFATGLIVGVLWGAWHLLQQLFISGTYSGRLPLILYLPLAVLAAITQLTAYRVLMVWLYDRTGSLLVTTLMHASLTASTIFIFTPVATGLTFLTYGWVLAAALWVVVAAVALATGGLLSRQPQQVHAA